MLCWTYSPEAALTGARGAGRGFDPKEFDCSGGAPTDSYAKFRENVEIVLAAWRNERLSYHGQFYEFNDVEVLPKPAQDPHPPVWIASSSDEAIAWWAQQGFAILMDPHSSHSAIQQKYRDYRTALADHNHDMQQDIPMARLLAIAPRKKEAEAVARAGASWMFSTYANPKSATNTSLGKHQAELAKGSDPLTRYLDEVVIHGTPEMVVDQLQGLEEELPLNYLLAAPLSHESFQLLTDQVMPRLA